MNRWLNKQTGTKILTGLVLAALFIGWKFYNKDRAHDDIQKSLIDLCVGDDECVAAVNTHFDACFSEAYDIGGRHRSGGLNQDKFLKCFNTKAGGQFFAVEPLPEEGETDPNASGAHPAATPHTDTPQQQHMDVPNDDLEDGN